MELKVLFFSFSSVSEESSGPDSTDSSLEEDVKMLERADSLSSNCCFFSCEESGEEGFMFTLFDEQPVKQMVEINRARIKDPKKNALLFILTF